MNIYVVGLNQLYDIQIDKVIFYLLFENIFFYHVICSIIVIKSYFFLEVNKPSLPLASGEFSVATGAVLVLTSLIMVY